ncbi:MAG: type II toxin-antitoxin system VapC family toxin [Rubrobacter sp.]|nr:type II toxin-antitoxin system VapC family toxin [Rubrobacter sp.]
MRFWDSSALLPLIFRQAASERVSHLLREDGGVAVWWGTWAECAVAISRLKREKGFGDETEDDARARLDQLADDWYEVEPSEVLRLLAMIVSRDHHLKAADCLQLAAALRWCEGVTESAGFVSLDNRLRRAAQDEGFVVLPESLEIG